MHDKLIGQSFHVDISNNSGMVGFSGTLVSIDGDIWVFKVFDKDTVLVNFAWIRTLRPYTPEERSMS